MAIVSRTFIDLSGLECFSSQSNLAQWSLKTLNDVSDVFYCGDRSSVCIVADQSATWSSASIRLQGSNDNVYWGNICDRSGIPIDLSQQTSCVSLDVLPNYFRLLVITGTAATTIKINALFK